MPELVHVRTVYGDSFLVARFDYANKNKRLLPLYARDGRKFTETPAGIKAVIAGKATHLHRDNIIA